MSNEGNERGKLMSKSSVRRKYVEEDDDHTLYAEPEEEMFAYRYSRLKHVAHCCTFAVVVSSLMYTLISLTAMQVEIGEIFSPWKMYGSVGSVVLFVFRLFPLLALPQVILNCVGLLFFNAFPGRVTLKGSSLLTPLICIRIVTRGYFPQLVRENVARNMARCSEAGMENFLIEVVTDRAIGLQKHPRIREVVVPHAYKPKSGALYKARALQYCLEDDVNVLTDRDYLVHLDEETILTSNSIRGIINFVLDGKYDFGQGLITYANDKIVNWITTLADSMRVADDMGKLRAQFHLFHKPIMNWKGSFIVSKVEAERNVSFDNGVNGSIAEDCYFAMRAYMKGYMFSFVDGEMWEKSPFTLWDFIEQRKRWVQGISLVVHAPEIPWRYKIWLALSLYAWITMPLSLSNIVIGIIFPLPIPLWLNILCSFVASVNIYMYIFGALKSLSCRRLGIFKYVLCLASLVFVIVASTILESVAVLFGVFGSKKKFYIVRKDDKDPTLWVNEKESNGVLTA